MGYPHERVEMTCRCRDSDVIPRVPNAGAIESYRGQSVQVMHNGLRVATHGYYGEWVTDVIGRLRGCHEPQEELAFWETVKRLPDAPTMLELGAYWGYYTCWFLKDHPAGRAFCVEPDPNHMKVGQANLQLNDLRATFVNAGVGARPAAGRSFTCESDGAVRRLPIISVDSFVREHGIPYIDVLLADIQGAEYEMLQGALETIAAGKVRFMLISTHHRSICRYPLMHQVCLAKVRQLGGHVFAEHSIAESFSGDGLVAASFAPEDRSLPAVPLSYNRASTNIYREPEYELAALSTFPVAVRNVLRSGKRILKGSMRRLGRVEQ